VHTQTDAAIVLVPAPPRKPGLPLWLVHVCIMQPFLRDESSRGPLEFSRCFWGFEAHHAAPVMCVYAAWWRSDAMRGSRAWRRRDGAEKTSRPNEWQGLGEERQRALGNMHTHTHIYTQAYKGKHTEHAHRRKYTDQEHHTVDPACIFMYSCIRTCALRYSRRITTYQLVHAHEYVRTWACAELNAHLRYTRRGLCTSRV
jgi:hypothetical protein